MWGIEPVLRLLRCENPLIARVALLIVFRAVEAAVALGKGADLAEVVVSVLPPTSTLTSALSVHSEPDTNALLCSLCSAVRDVRVSLHPLPSPHRDVQ